MPDRDVRVITDITDISDCDGAGVVYDDGVSFLLFNLGEAETLTAHPRPVQSNRPTQDLVSDLVQNCDYTGALNDAEKLSARLVKQFLQNMLRFRGIHDRECSLRRQ